MKSTRSKRHARALGAAMAGILAGSTLAHAQGVQTAQRGVSLRSSDAVQQLIVADEGGDDPHNCNGPDGCSGADKSGEGA